MADKDFGVKRINLINSSGTPNITSPNNLTVNASTVSISTNVSIGGQVVSNLIINSNYSVGIGTSIPLYKLDVLGGDLRIGDSNSQGIVLTSPNGTKYRIIVQNNGTLTTTIV